MRIELLQAKESLEQKIKSLEIQYPNYYQYKYADKVRSLSSLQDYLAKRGQRFIEYFLQDTTSFALCVTPDKTSLIRIRYKEGNIETSLTRFINFCSDENALNGNFPGFLSASNQLYNTLYSPFHLPGGRVIICQDNYLFPFEALTTSSAKPDFLIYDYAISYVYSAQNLMHPYEELTGKGDFLGIAPVNFAAYPGLPDLNSL